MKKVLMFGILFSLVFGASAQLNPISWSFSAKKIGDKMYELQMKATIQNKWHLYSQVQPEDAIAIPTSFKFNPNPIFVLEGKITETGKMEKYTDKILGVSANQYSNSVVFTQKIRLKANAKTNVTGSVEYQTCDDEKCLPPKTVNFSVSLK
ncbi:MAG: protein-disulfide reductase DsbD domain-containing protein [Chitinophagaceae bacterium]